MVLLQVAEALIVRKAKTLHTELSDIASFLYASMSLAGEVWIIKCYTSFVKGVCAIRLTDRNMSLAFLAER